MGLPGRLEAPVFFTSASKVKIPFVGDDTRNVEFVDTRYYPISNPLEKHHHEVSKHFVRMVSNDVKFDDAVVHERCSHSLPYSNQNFSKLYHPNFSKKPLRIKDTECIGRFDVAGYNRKVPTQFQKSKYIKVPKSNQEDNSKLPVLTIPNANPPSDSTSKPRKKSVLNNKTYTSDAITIQDWDQAMLANLSKDTAHWIVYQADIGATKRAKLSKFLKDQYGDHVSNTHIVRPDDSETDLQKKNKLIEDRHSKDAKKLELLEKEKMSLRTDKTYRKSLAEYYRLPKFLSQEQSSVVAAANEVNETAQGIKVKHLEQPPPPKMEDFLVGVAGQFIRSTDNEFEQRLYTEQAKPVHLITNDKSRLVMDDLTEYTVKIRPKFPPEPKCWTMSDTDKKLGNDVNYNHATFSKGLRRWTSLPKPADFMSERGINPPKKDEAPLDFKEYSRLDSVVDNRALITLVEEWRSKWKLVGQWQDIPFAEIIIDLDSLHENVRLGAVAACAMASLHKKPINELANLAIVPSHLDSARDKTDDTSGHLPELLIEKVKEKLNDSNNRVRLAAAICLHSLNLTSDEILKILQDNLTSGYTCDKLVAAQCLALSDITSPDVIRIIVELLLDKDETTATELTASQREQATILLVHLSKNTKLVHSLLAEQLNSSRWRDRAIACQVISKLVGKINKDMVHKLTTLMWNDWSSEVRKVAAETLGRTGHGKDIHFELREKLAHGNESMKVNVLRKLSHLGIMTAALLPTFMLCFSNEYVSVRKEACKTTGKLRLAGEEIGKKLLYLMQFDPSWKVKAEAVTAIKESELYSEKSLEALIWALRFEDEPEVRICACASLKNYFMKKPPDDEALRILQDRALVEPDPFVREEVQKTLKSLDAASEGDNADMIRQIKSEVKRLCHRGIIAAKIAVYENELDRFQNKVQYLGVDLSDDTESNISSRPSTTEKNRFQEKKSVPREKRSQYLHPHY